MIEPADYLGTIRYLRARVSALVDEVVRLTEERDNAHRAGYEMAAEQARELGAHLVRHDVAIAREKIVTRAK